MDHPAIAKVFDAGTTPAGQPYLVMECVDGLPITDYCDSKKLSIRGDACNCSTECVKACSTRTRRQSFIAT
jgi:hypothetical protein